jgi:hypothetical protein
MGRATFSSVDPITSSGNEALLDGVARAAFDYFLQTVNPANGLVTDTTREHWPCSIAVVGLALSVYPVAVEPAGWRAARRSNRAWRPALLSATAISAPRRLRGNGRHTSAKRARGVDTYRSRMMHKPGIDDLPHLVKFAIQNGITQLDGMRGEG